MDVSEPPVAALLGAMAHWRGLFSPDGKPYRSLNRTLMNLPPAVPPELVCQLSQIRLERPVVNPLEITTTLSYVSVAGVLLRDPARNRFRLFHHATAAEIADAMRRIGAQTDRALRETRLEDVQFAIRYLCDYPEPFTGRPPGLVDRVVRWHRQIQRRERVQEIARELGGADRPTQQPPTRLPATPGVRFLATVGEVVEEGLAMKHCIATRAADAVRGRCFLFHVEYGGERASVEVSLRGQIVEADGPHNTKNKAVGWGVMQLRAWAKGLHVTAAERRRPGIVRSDPNQLSLQWGG